MDFCRKHLVVNQEAFASPRLDLIINDARFCFHPFYLLTHAAIYVNTAKLTRKIFESISRAELENRSESFDVIVGDLADPIEGGPCYQLYTKSFYELVVKPKLSEGGIFVTQVTKNEIQ